MNYLKFITLVITKSGDVEILKISKVTGKEIK